MDRPNILDALDKSIEELAFGDNCETNTISIDVVIKEDFEAEVKEPDDFNPWYEYLILALHDIIRLKPKRNVE